MSDVSKRAIAWLGVTAVFLLFILWTNSQRDTEGETETRLSNLGYSGLQTAASLPSIPLLGKGGAEARLSQADDVWTVVFFGFTSCPDVCPTTLAILDQAVSAMTTPPRVVVVSVDPARDTPEAMSRYVAGFNPTFVGLTGSLENIDRLALRLGIRIERGTQANDPVGHSGNLVVLRGSLHVGFIRPPLVPERIQEIMLLLTARS